MNYFNFAIDNRQSDEYNVIKIIKKTGFDLKQKRKRKIIF